MSQLRCVRAFAVVVTLAPLAALFACSGSSSTDINGPASSSGSTTGDSGTDSADGAASSDTGNASDTGADSDFDAAQCVGSHPLVDGGLRFCAPQHCYCAAKDACFAKSIAERCCPGAIVCY